ncbi:hypothetical protein JCM11641_004240 [Rhodosporidiobolus odoratus]
MTASSYFRTFFGSGFAEMNPQPQPLSPASLSGTSGREGDEMEEGEELVNGGEGEDSLITPEEEEGEATEAAETEPSDISTDADGEGSASAAEDDESGSEYEQRVYPFRPSSLPKPSQQPPLPPPTPK